MSNPLANPVNFSSQVYYVSDQISPISSQASLSKAPSIMVYCELGPSNSLCTDLSASSIASYSLLSTQLQSVHLKGKCGHITLMASHHT